jgi:hypothetical protein
VLSFLSFCFGFLFLSFLFYHHLFDGWREIEMGANFLGGCQPDPGIPQVSCYGAGLPTRTMALLVEASVYQYEMVQKK